MPVLRALVVMLVGLVALVAWPTAAQAQTVALTLAADGSVSGLGSAGNISETLSVNYNTPSAGDYTVSLASGVISVLT